MGPPHFGASSSSASPAAAATKLRDEALAVAKALEDEAACLESTNTERNKQLLEEAELLKSAAAAQDRVRAAADTLNLERAQADTLEQKAAALGECLRPQDLGDGAYQDDDDDRSIFSDAANVARLHNQATTVQNIRNLVPIVLDLQSSNYSKWRGHILLILRRFSLQDHVLSDAAHPNDPAWSRMDFVVVSWIFNTISPDLPDDIHQRDGISAHVAWLGIEQQFLNNWESCAMLLDAQFLALSRVPSLSMIAAAR
jgi:hypothetical protein